MVDAARKGLSQAEQLPGKLQEQIAEIAAQTARSRTEEKKAMEKEFSPP